jgi:hypothetical protein
MKTKLFLLAITICINSYAQIGFQEHIIIDDTFSTIGASAVYAADVNGDGFTDVISASFDDNKIAWHENLDGLGNFGTQQVISLSEAGAISVYGADIDGDGDMDVISASFTDNTISWYENTDGLGNFSSQQIINNNLDGLMSIYAGDIDSDGDIDILSASRFDNKIAWYENINGQGSFGTQRLISTAAYGARSVYADDIDGDGDLDVLSANSWDDKVAWYRNTDGQGNFGGQQLITTDADYATAVFTSDIDGDGDMDVLSASQDDNKIAWYENLDGIGNFGSQNIISTIALNAQSFSASDFDGDGDIDVFSSSQNNYVAWHENLDGLGSFETHQIGNENIISLRCVYVVDLDNDGDQDVITASYNDDKIAWFENKSGLGDFEKQQIIPKYVLKPSNVNYSDINGDGHLDLLSFDNGSYGVQGSKLAWYENLDGTGNFGDQNVITASADLFPNVMGCDVDGDGDMDILSSSSFPDKVVWFENTDGLGNFSLEKIISTTVDFAISIEPSDIDGDGDLDVLSVSFSDGIVEWYENTDGLGTFGSGQVIDSSSNFPRLIRSADIDNDGDKDVIVNYGGVTEISWFENVTGSGNSWEQHTITTGTYRIESLVIYDIDQDNYMDVLFTSLSFPNSKVAWCKNLNGQGNFGSQQILSSTLKQSFASISDIDNDGDPDVVVSSNGLSKLVWFANSGGGNFGSERIISENLIGPWSNISLDIDDDDDIDIIVAGYSENKIIKFENLGLLGLDENNLQRFIIYPNPGNNRVLVTAETDIVKIDIYDYQGRLALFNVESSSIDISTLNTGIYFIKITDHEGNTQTSKLIKE